MMDSEAVFADLSGHQYICKCNPYSLSSTNKLLAENAGSVKRSLWLQLFQTTTIIIYFLHIHQSIYTHHPILIFKQNIYKIFYLKCWRNSFYFCNIWKWNTSKCSRYIKHLNIIVNINNVRNCQNQNVTIYHIDSDIPSCLWIYFHSRDIHWRGMYHSL